MIFQGGKKMMKKIIVFIVCIALIPLIMPSGTGQMQESIGSHDWHPQKNGESTYDITQETICINSMNSGGAWAEFYRGVYNSNLDYTVEFDFKLLDQNTHWFVLYSDGFLFLVVDWGTNLRNYPSATLSFNLEIDRWYAIRMEAQPTKGTYDIYIDGTKQATATGVTRPDVEPYHNSSSYSSSYIDGPGTIFIGDPDDTSYNGGTYNRGSGCWKTIDITYGAITGSEGLFGEYMNFQPFTTAVGQKAPSGLFETASVVFTRTDPVIDFAWEYGSPDSVVNVDNFGARWTGEIYAPVTGTYTFIVWSDDGNRLYVDNTIIIDDWTDHPPTRFDGTIDLTGGHWYPITLTFFEDADHATIVLYWKPPGGQEELIPSHNLRPSSGTIPDLTAIITTPSDNSIYQEGDNINFAGSASGGIQPYSYTWVSTQDGQLSTGTGFSLGTLNPGTHLITLTVTDAGAQSATDQITLTITASTTGTILYIEDRTIASGTESQTKIMCTNANNIGDFGIDITYDPSVIEILDVYKGALQNIVSTTQDWNILSPGTLRIGIITSQGITGDGSLVHIRFKAIGSSGDFTTLTLDATAHDANTFTAKTLLTYNGQITISSQIPIGDGNGDGKVTWLDALLALRMYVGKEPVNLILDVNHDGEVTPVDATMILKASLGKIILT